MAVGVREVDRVADPVVGELHVQAPLGELDARPLQPRAVDAEGDVEDPHRRRLGVVRSRGRVHVAVEDRDAGALGRHHHRPVPGLVGPLEPQHLGVELARALDVRDADRHVVEPGVPEARHPRRG